VARRLLQGLTGTSQETTDQFERMGLIIDEDVIKAADDFGDQMGVLSKVGTALIANVLAPALPGLVELAQWLGKAATATIGFAQSLEDGLIKAFMSARIGWDGFILAIAETSQKIPLLGKHLGATDETIKALQGNLQMSKDTLMLFSMENDKGAVSAKKAMPALIGLGEAHEKVSGSTKKHADAIKTLDPVLDALQDEFDAASRAVQLFYAVVAQDDRAAARQGSRRPVHRALQGLAARNPQDDAVHGRLHGAVERTSPCRSAPPRRACRSRPSARSAHWLTASRPA
jgi:hypothetical protein